MEMNTVKINNLNPVFYISVHVIFVLIIAASALFSQTYVPPIGILAPSFGIEETVEDIVVYNNHIHHNSGDAFQATHAASANPPRYVYIGRNIMHEDRENGVDLKYVQDIVISQNVLYIIGNTIYDVNVAIDQFWMENFSLHIFNYPNPFNPSTIISWQLAVRWN